MNNILDTLEARGYAVLGMCPDTPEGLQKVHTEKKLNFPLYGDSSLELSTALGIAFHLDDATVDMYLTKYNIDLEKASGEKHHNLPVPAVIVFDAAGKVRFVYTNPDHTTRLSAEELLKNAV